MKYTIENVALRLTVESHGSELWDLRRKAAPDEPLLWDGDPAFWSRRAPLLFPWCGRVEDNWFEDGGKRYAGLPQHGFARDMEHTLVAKTPDSLTFRLDWPGDGEKFPWKFSFTTCHALKGNAVETTCTGVNLSDRPMPAQIGFHAGLRCPFTRGKSYSDYFVRFEQPEAFAGARQPQGGGPRDVFPLDEHTFDQDSICFPGLQSRWLQVEERGTGRYLRVDTEGFPFTLIWSPKGCGRFICIEPWTGFLGPGHDLAKRPGTVVLQPGESLTATHTLTVGV